MIRFHCAGPSEVDKPESPVVVKLTLQVLDFGRGHRMSAEQLSENGVNAALLVDWIRRNCPVIDCSRG